MNDDWRMRECVNQMLLYVALRARNAIMKRPADDLPISEPLPPITVAVKKEAQAMCDELDRNPGNVEPVKRLMDKVLRTRTGNPHFASLIKGTPAWTISAVVAWWIRAGVAIADWRPSVYGPSAAGLSDQPQTRFLDAAINALQLEDGEEWPPVWCAHRARSWKLPGQPSVDLAGVWDRPGSRDEYRMHLVAWCGDPRREGIQSAEPLDEDGAKRWVRDYKERYQDFAQASVRLLREECRFGDLRDAAAPGDSWRVYSEPRLPAGMFEVLRHPIHRRSDPDGPPIAAGWLVVPLPNALIAELRNATTAHGSLSAVRERLLCRAAVAWSPSDESFGSVESLKAACRDAPHQARRLAALASLVTLVELSAAANVESGEDLDQVPRDPIGRIRLALMLEGIRARREPPASDERFRLIPIDAAAIGSAYGETTKLVLVGGEDIVEVGVVGQPSRCPKSLLLAIDEVDWCHWALQACTGSRAAEHLTSAEWETCKRRLLMVEGDGPAIRHDLARAFEELHPVRLAVEHLRAGPDDASDAAWLGDALAGLEQAICSRLTVPETGATSMLYPPRAPDARISLAAWLDVPHADEPRTSRWDVAWERSAVPFGTAVREESRSDGRWRVVFSAGESATVADLRLLGAAGVIQRPFGPWNRMAEPITVVLRAAVWEAASPDMTAAVSQIKAAIAGAQADAFDELVHLAIDGDTWAVGWIQMMQADPRFEFVCHPAIDINESRVSPRKPAAGDAVFEWRDADAPVDDELEIRFARDATAARRILSRGRPEAASVEARAHRLVNAVHAGPVELITAARQVQQATDLRRLLGESVINPMPSAIAAANALVQAGNELGDAANQAFRELSDWCLAFGCRLMPERWHPSQGIAADGLDVVRVDFHPTVPAGNVVVERFGATGRDGAVVAAWEGFLSAGPTPVGFADVVRLTHAVAGDREETMRLQRCVADFASRVLKGQGASAAANLFDVAWKAVMALPDDDALSAAAAAVHHFLDKSHGMIAFRPKSLTEYPEAWLRTREGGPARGLRVDRLVRPGLRNLDNSLIYPAIVETG